MFDNVGELTDYIEANIELLRSRVKYVEITKLGRILDYEFEVEKFKI